MVVDIVSPSTKNGRKDVRIPARILSASSSYSSCPEKVDWGWGDVDGG
jgi:hypothetical protein